MSALRRILWLAALWLMALQPLAAESPRIVPQIDGLLESHWKAKELSPAARAGDAQLLRRLMLDLAGRVPTADEVHAYLADASPDRYERKVKALLESPEFAWYWGVLLDEIVQGPMAGNAGFVGYMRKGLGAKKRWDTIFREIMLGPWDNDERKPAMAFLERRTKDLDRLTADVTRSFFGVDITCARCHNHPLVDDWKREHYYGIAAFLVRTNGGKGAVGEKGDGEARFAGKDGKERVAKMMFLSGRIVEEPAKDTKKSAAKYSRREQLVESALAEKTFFSRSFANRLWEYFFGRGLVDPVDQIHSGNPPSVPGVLDALAEDFIANGYDIHRLVETLVLTRAYRLDSRSDTSMPADAFAVARLRPLHPRQWAYSFLVASGDNRAPATPESLAALDKQAADLIVKLDPRAREFQSSTREALFLSNGEAVRGFLVPREKNLAQRLAELPSDKERVSFAFQLILGREPGRSEREQIAAELTEGLGWPEVLWALFASAEFRFNH